MSDPIQHLMREVGPLVAAIDTIEQVGEQSWAVGFDQETWLSVSHNEASGKITLAIDCGQPSEQNRLKLYEALLVYNYLWEETGGLRLALDGTGGRVVLVFDIAAHQLDVCTLATVIENVVATARLWKQSIQGIGQVPDLPPAVPMYGIRA